MVLVDVPALAKSVKFPIWGNNFPLFRPRSEVQLWPHLCSPPSSHSRCLFFLPPFKAYFGLTSVLHHFYAKASLRPLISWTLLAIFGVNICVANVEIRTVMRSPIPNWTAGSCVGKGRGNALCPGERNDRVQGIGSCTPLTPCGSQALSQPLAPLCGEFLVQCDHQLQLSLDILSITLQGCSWGDKGNLQGKPRAPLSAWQGWGSQGCLCLGDRTQSCTGGTRAQKEGM